MMAVPTECVILAAGEGKRMRPLTTNRPKVMIPLANRPMLEHLIIAARDAGIRRFILVVGYGEQAVRDHFGDGSGLGVEIEYVLQKRQRGTADALLSAEGLVSGSFLMMNGDMIVSSGEIEALSELPAPAMAVAETENPGEYGVVVLESNRVVNLEEKSKHPKSSMINAGAYLFSPEIFDLLQTIGLSGRGEYELTDALTRYIDEGRLAAVHFRSWMDVGYPWDILAAHETILPDEAAENAGFIEEGVFITGQVTIGEGTVIRFGSYIEGPCCIGKNCIIGPHAYIRPKTAIGDSCHIGHAVEVKNSVIFHGTKIPHFNYIGDSVIGAGCNFGAGTKIANLRHDHGIVSSGGIATGRKKFGAVIGDDVLFGINCSVNTGSIIGSNSRIAPHSFVDGVYDDDTIISR
ncbi:MULTISPECIES: bifunctional sugar-1-phosphate nucleotidylyltransferase/acetyltransferase [Methanocalculus]|uniref:bifunctional sugar-1-phosphate nucleotidylyltransferase/acetyltransferase n=1 Tax=Methanocalculus TaxID=71151 RepID=UPI0020A22984|nr:MULTISPECIES: bifunctional sugar-1-phosphate nucleotidylyltransferase/acetyltransferase [unclassified Methanocalculus]MCP1662640.1 bifunctional UDP-N-acetylglucosamine pyrophosphorylase/glucosamine-1-phosphate N-acetyltransferase [Methanocalculus sp. AMF5]